MTAVDLAFILLVLTLVVHHPLCAKVRGQADDYEGSFVRAESSSQELTLLSCFPGHLLRNRTYTLDCHSNPCILPTLAIFRTIVPTCVPRSSEPAHEGCPGVIASFWKTAPSTQCPLGSIGY